MKKILIGLSLMFAFLSVQTAVALPPPGSLFNVSASGLTLTITTIPNNPNNNYPAGIRLSTAGYSIVSGCTPQSNGFCTFPVNQNVPATIVLSGESGAVDFQLCLNSVAPASCAPYSSRVTGGFTIGGTISGLTASGLVLQNNGGDNLSVTSGASSFQFSTPVMADGSYNVTVSTPAAGLTCTVGNGSGLHVMANVTNISIVCSTTAYTVGGTISGLSASGLVLRNNGGNNLSVAAGASSFQFSTPVAAGGSYNVTISQQPRSLTCTIGTGSGTNVFANVTSVTVSCVPATFSFIDIQGTGSYVNGNDDTSTLVSLSSGHPINLFGTPYTALYASPNGIISSNQFDDFSNSCLPATSASGNTLYVLWDDLFFVTNPPEGVYYQYFSNCPRASGVVANEGCHVFEWYQTTYWRDKSPRFNFEAIVYDQSSLVVYQYGLGNTQYGASATVGAQNQARSNVIQIECNTGGSIPDNTVFSFYPL